MTDSSVTLRKAPAASGASNSSSSSSSSSSNTASHHPVTVHGRVNAGNNNSSNNNSSSNSKTQSTSVVTKVLGAMLFVLLVTGGRVTHHAQLAYSFVRFDMFGGKVTITNFDSCEANGMQPRYQSAQDARADHSNSGSGSFEDDGPVRVYNGITFLSELDMLELRLNELSDVVDKFVLVEELWTFSGKPKPLYYAENKERFAKFNDRIVHVVLNVSDSSDAWARQAGARGAVVEGLDRAGARPQDLVILGDLDEIPNPKHLALLKRCRGYTLPVTFHMPEYYYDFGCEDEHSHWTRIKLMRRRHLQRSCVNPPRGVVCPETTRENDPAVLEALLNPDGIPRGQPAPLRLHNAGWHLSYFMSFEKIVEKVGAYAHTERDTEQNRDPKNLQCLVKKCVHVNGNSHGTRRSPSFESSPTHAVKWFTQGKAPWNGFYPEPHQVPAGSGC